MMSLRRPLDRCALCAMGTNANGQATDRAGGVAVYGTPEQMAQLYASITRMSEREPDSTFENEEVQDEGRRLVNLLSDRLGLTDG